MQVLYSTPSLLPLGLGPPHARTGVGTTYEDAGKKLSSMKSLLQLNAVGARLSRAAPGGSGPLLRLPTLR
jgi:hypothetical protein